ncbi:type I restriction endonuclease subunit R, partial [uncultured Desulfovibrio sp.]|uniref:type I restriction endonuclease subunit R n=1 Tax=uncultured Desulfovibrio sp. TaxID=167968 RepID=UPI0026038B15
MALLTENHIEEFALKLLSYSGYTCYYGPDIAPGGSHPLRSSLSSPILEGVLQEAVDRLNPSVPAAARQEAVRQVLRVSSPDLISANELFHRLLTQGVSVTYQKDGSTRGDLVWLVDFNNPENNEFTAVNQFSFVENNANRRPDIVLFVNGLPLVVIELKNAADESATVKTAFQQLQTYKDAIPSLMAYNALLVISDGLEARAGSLSADFSRFSAWKSEDGTKEAPRLKSQLEVLVNGMLNKATLLDLIRFFTVFQKIKKEDDKGQVRIITLKILAAYHQYYAVNKAVASTLQAARRDDEQRGKGGVIWHTQGSGKSLSMVFFSGKIVDRLSNPTIVVLTDRNDLDDQLFDTFAASAQLLGQEPKQAADREELKTLLKVASGGIVFSTMQKFMPEEGNIHELLSERRNIVVITDEAHRTQYGFKAREVNVRDSAGNVIGKKTVYGLAKYLRDALPNATYLGFTGTPIEKTDANTRTVFGDYIDVYDIARAVDDGATVPIFYESRMAKIDLPKEGRQLIRELDEELEEDDAEQAEKARSKRARLEALIGSEKRLTNIARDIVEHFEARQKVFSGKGLVVCMSRPIAAALYEHIIALRPEWHDADLK